MNVCLIGKDTVCTIKQEIMPHIHTPGKTQGTECEINTKEEK